MLFYRYRPNKETRTDRKITMVKKFAHQIGFDDAPFTKEHRGDVLLVATVYCRHRIEAVLSGKIRRDGRNASDAICRIVTGSRFYSHSQLILLQGIAFAGFNVVDIQQVLDETGLPVLVVCRKNPNMEKIRQALIQHVPGGARKWKIIERTGPMQPAGNVFVQRAGISLEDSRKVLKESCINSDLPDPLRTAHLIAGGIISGESKHRA